MLASSAGPGRTLRADGPAASRSELRLVVESGHSAAPTSLEVSQDGRRLLSAADAKGWRPSARSISEAILWDAGTGLELRRFDLASGGPCARLSPDGRRVVGAQADGGLAVWDAETGRQVAAYRQSSPPTEVEGVTRHIAFGAQGRWVIQLRAHELTLWDVDTGAPTWRIPLEAGANKSEFGACAVLEDDSAILASIDRPSAEGASTSAIVVLNPRTGKEVRRFASRGPVREMISLRGGAIAVCASWAQVGVYEVSSGETRWWIDEKPARGAAGIGGLAVDLGRGVVYSTSWTWKHILEVHENLCRAYDAVSGAVLREFRQGLTWSESMRIAVCPKTSMVYVGPEPLVVLDPLNLHVVERFSRRQLLTGLLAYQPGRLVLGGEQLMEGRRTHGWVPQALPGSLLSRVDTIALDEREGSLIASGLGRESSLWEVGAPDPSQVLGVVVQGWASDGQQQWDHDLGESEELLDALPGREPVALVYRSSDRRELRLLDPATGGRAVWTDSDEGWGKFSPSSINIRLVPPGDKLLILEGDHLVLRPLGGDAPARLLPIRLDRARSRWSAALDDVAPSGHHAHLSYSTTDPLVSLFGHHDHSVIDLESNRETDLKGGLGTGADVTASGFSAGTGHPWLAGTDGAVVTYDASSGAVLSVLHGPPMAVEAAVWMTAESRVAVAYADGGIRFWDERVQRVLCTLYLLQPDGWVVVDGEARFDSSEGARARGLHWVSGSEIIELSQLADRYWDPGLLGKCLGTNPDPLRSVPPLGVDQLFPNVHVAVPAPGTAVVRLELTDRGGGIGETVVLLNGKELELGGRRKSVPSPSGTTTYDLDLTGHAGLRPGVENQVEIVAYNRRGDLHSRGMPLVWVAPGQPTVVARHLWGVVCGVSDYSGSDIDLQYAAEDAADMWAAVRLAYGSWMGPDHVHLALLSTSRAAGALRPNRENLVRALAECRQAGPDDIFFLYLSGHGVNRGGEDGDFYFLLTDANGSDMVGTEMRSDVAVSAAELRGLIRDIPARGRQVLILDTCAAGKALGRLADPRDVPGSQVRALERLASRTGVYVLAGCAADQASYEASRYGQGVLTYSLLLGLRGAALRDDEWIDVRKWFEFAEDAVPRFARDVGGIQRPIVQGPGGGSFDLGRLTSQARQGIPLRVPKPVLLRSSFQDENKRRDALGLATRVNGALRDLAATGRDAPLVYVDADEMPDSHQVVGRYTVDGSRVRVSLSVFHGDEELRASSEPIVGSTLDLDELAQRVLTEARRRLGG